jgi:hypothetical protein
MLGVLGLVLMISAPAMAQRSEVLSAEWGIPGNRVDVTARVRTFEQNGVLQFVVTRGALGLDPAPHRTKDLIIRVRRPNGEVEEFNYPERGTVNLQLESHEDHDWHDLDTRGHDWRDGDADRSGLRILRASYGVEGQLVDVSDALRNRVEGDRLFVRIDNYNLGIDPAPGQRKLLHIVYSFNGHRHETTVDEKTYLQLP